MQTTAIASDVEEFMATRSTLAPSPSVAAVTHGERTVLLEQRSGRYFGLSDVGVRTWELIQERRFPLEIVHRLEAEYDVDRARLVEDTVALLRALLGARLVRWD